LVAGPLAAVGVGLEFAGSEALAKIVEAVGEEVERGRKNLGLVRSLRNPWSPDSQGQQFVLTAMGHPPFRSNRSRVGNRNR
jgi:hypothetical protein